MDDGVERLDCRRPEPRHMHNLEVVVERRHVVSATDMHMHGCLGVTQGLFGCQKQSSGRQARLDVVVERRHVKPTTGTVVWRSIMDGQAAVQ